MGAVEESHDVRVEVKILVCAVLLPAVAAHYPTFLLDALFVYEAQLLALYMLAAGASNRKRYLLFFDGMG